jgi:hypothetical protein
VGYVLPRLVDTCVNLMRRLLGFLKLLTFCIVGAVVMGGVVLVVGMIAAPIIITGSNPHTDGLGRMGVGIIATLGGAADGALGVVVWTAYGWLKKS